MLISSPSALSERPEGCVLRSKTRLGSRDNLAMTAHASRHTDMARGLRTEITISADQGHSFGCDGDVIVRFIVLPASLPLPPSNGARLINRACLC